MTHTQILSPVWLKPRKITFIVGIYGKSIQFKMSNAAATNASILKM